MTTGTTGVTRYPNATRDTVEAGNAFEDYVCDRLAEIGLILRTYKSREFQWAVGENKTGWEIKLDDSHAKYGHLSIEIAEKTRDDPNLPWTNSGIMKRDNSWLYIHGNRELFWVLFKPVLLEHYKSTHPKIHEWNGTIKKFYLEYCDADKLGIRIQNK